MFILAQQAAATAAEVVEEVQQVAHLNYVDYYAITAYMGLMIAVGLLCRNNSDDISDYIRMGGRSTWWLAGLSVFMASFSCATFTGYAAQGYLAGWSFMLNYWLVAMLFFIQAAFFAPWMRNTRAVTPPDAIRLRFGPVIEQITVYTGFLASFVWGGVFLWTLATFCATVFGFAIWQVIVIVGVVIVFYSVAGGSWSVQITDNLQSFLLVPMTIVMAGLALYQIGGLGEMFNQIDTQGLTEDFAMIKSMDHEYTATVAKVKPMFYTIPWLAAMLITQFIASANMRSCYRYLSIKTGREAQKAALLAGILTFVGSFIWVIPVIVGRLKFSADIESLPLRYPADGAYAITAAKLLPPGMLGLVVVAMFSATMSSMDSNLTGTAGNLAKNMYAPLARFYGYIPLKGRKLMTFAKFINLFLGLWAIGMALLFDKLSDAGIFGAMVMILALIGMPTGVPFVVSFFMKKVPAWGPIVGVVFGFSMSYIMKFNPGDILQNGLWGFNPFNMVELADGVPVLVEGETVARGAYWHEIVFWVGAFSLLPTILTRVFWTTSSHEYRKRVDHFFKQINTPVDVDKEVDGEIDHSLLKTVGGLGLLTSMIVLPLVIFAEDLPGQISALFVFFFIFTITLMMYVKGVSSSDPSDDDPSSKLRKVLFSPSGRICRHEYFRGFIILLMINLVGVLVGWKVDIGGAPIFASVLGLLSLWTAMVITVKRLHDRGLTAWWRVALLVAGSAAIPTCWMNIESANNNWGITVGSAIAILFVLIDNWLLKGTEGENQFGPDPMDSLVVVTEVEVAHDLELLAQAADD